MAEMAPVGGVMTGVQRYHLILGPFLEHTAEIRFRFRCSCPGCTCQDECCQPREHMVRIVQSGTEIMEGTN
jgi:hypothetical protein